MICPHCNTGVRFDVNLSSAVYDDEERGKQQGYDISHGFCPECSHLVVVIRRGQYYQHDFNDDGSRELIPSNLEIIYPRIRTTKKIEPEVPESYRNDFLEACEVLPISPKASAAISRRLLQHILRDEFGIKKRDLEKEIVEFNNKPGIPSDLSESLDAIRIIGNFAAHPSKNTQTGEIIEVEPGEADWLVDVLETLFNFAFVQPKRLAARKTALNSKLAAAGKLPMK